LQDGHRRSQGVPQGEEKNFEAKFTGEIVSAPDAEQESNFGGRSLIGGGRGYLGSFSVF